MKHVQRLLCRNSKRCAASSCDRLIDGAEKYCTTHTCQWGRCRKFADCYGGCVKHGCVKCNKRWHSGKPKARRGVKYCEAHLCRVEGCKEDKDPGDVFCIRHSCFKTGCGEVAEHWRGYRGVCESHCEVPGCARSTLKYYRCARHICNWPQCTAIIDGITHTVFCFSHVCINSGCSSIRQDVVLRQLYHPYCSTCLPLPRNAYILWNETASERSDADMKKRNDSASSTAVGTSSTPGSKPSGNDGQWHITDHNGEAGEAIADRE